MTENIKAILPHIIMALAIFMLAAVIVRVLHKVINSMIQRELKDENSDVTHLNFLKNSLRVVIYSIAIVLIVNTIPALKQVGTALFAGAGILAAIIGFASQQAFGNVVSGIFIIIFKPFRVGDTIHLDGHIGKVTNITLRHVVIRDLENRRIIVPNNKMSTEKIINSTIDDEKICRHISFSISYDSNIDKAMEIIADEIQKHPNFLDNRSAEAREAKELPVKVKVVALSDSSVDLRAFAWSKSNPESHELEWDILKNVKERFDNEGVEIPYPHRVVVQK